MKNFFLLLSIVVASCVAVNEPVNSNITVNHQRILETNIYIIPPPGFEEASDFIGLIKGEDAMLFITSNPENALSKELDEFEKKWILSEGNNVLEYKDVSINGFPGKYVHLKGKEDIFCQLVIFGNESFSVQGRALHRAGDDTTRTQLKNALFSMIYEENFPVNAIEKAVFSFNAPVNGLELIEASPGVYVYSIKPENYDDIQLAVQSISNNNSSARETAFTYASLDAYEMDNVQVIDTLAVEVNGYEAYKVHMQGDKNGQSNTIICWVVLNENNCAMLHSTFAGPPDGYVEYIEGLVRGIKMK
ncbi:hypothetical protein GCM10009122_27610 [Fulvivirga kasyanovii]|uniref:DUF1795 domain-containing protein n=1 Tax=Fulvivirga kasyanovii TaxID=396812 RepID=A0ABW9RUE4_9BACT|nr:hypothetical protein [Fulvivirga kasyanovii]MTI27326.1 hypothetical protein [Fulvivirga kasyanovii]